MRKRIGWLSILAVLATTAGLFAYVHFILEIQGGVSLRAAWDPNEPIQFSIWEGFDDSLPNIEPGTSVKAALREAVEKYARVSSLTLTVNEVPQRETGGQDGINLFTLPAPGSLDQDRVGQALGITGTLISFNGEIVEADIIFNNSQSLPEGHPGIVFTLNEADEDAGPQFTNFLGVATHEQGHAFGLDHPPHRTGIMFFQGGGFDRRFSALTFDEVAGINAIENGLGSYRLPGLLEITGEIQGSVMMNGSGVFGAFVNAVNSKGIIMASAITMPDGSYTIDNLPPDDYVVYVEPLSGPTLPANISGGIFNQPFDTNFLPRFFEDSTVPVVEVNADQITIGVDISVEAQVPTLIPSLLGTVIDIPGPISATSSGDDVRRGENNNLIVAGDNIDTLLDNGGAFSLSDRLVLGDLAGEGEFPPPFKVYEIALPSDTPQGPYSIFFQSPDELAVASGALFVNPFFRYLQTFSQFFNLAAFGSSQLLLLNTDLENDGAADGSIFMLTADGDFSDAGIVNLPGLDGNPSFELPAGGSFIGAARGNDFIGSVRVRADRDVRAVALLDAGETGLTGIPESMGTYSFIAPLSRNTAQGLNTGLALTNLEDCPVTVYLRVNDKQGEEVASTVLVLPTNGQLARFPDELFPPAQFPNFPGTLQGTLVVTASGKVAGAVIRTAPGVFTTFPVIVNRISTQNFYAQFAHVPAFEFSSEIVIVNSSPFVAATNVVVQVRASDGSTPDVVLNGTNRPGGQLTIPNIPPLGCVIISSGGAANIVGTVTVTSDTPVGGVVLFSAPDLGTAGVGESIPTSQAALVISQNLNAGIGTGIAPFNIQDKEITLDLEVRDTDGDLVDSGMLILGPHEHDPQFVDQLEDEGISLDSQFTGSLWISVREADCKVALTVLRQSPGVTTTFPVFSTERIITAVKD